MTTLTDQLRAGLAGRYDIEREIGAGGMATVYLARDPRHDRRVALKVLNPELGAVLGVERFLAEIKVTANLQHPNLLPLFDSGEVNGLLFYVMPYVEGESLRARLSRDKQLPIDEAIRIAVAVASALDYAHRHGVVHRDLKPENILLHDGQPVVADFGIALAVSNAGGGRITQTGLSLGTPQYMSPEQATGDRGIDGRTDIYSLGAMLYEMIGGEPPHLGTSAQAIIAKLMTEQPRSLTVLRRTVPPHVDAAVRCALEKLPADRFATAAQFAEAISGARAVSVTATAATPVHAPPRAWLPWGIAGVAGLAAVAAAVALVRRPEPAPLNPVHFSIAVKASTMIEPTRSLLVVSPNGSRIIYLAAPNGVPQLFTRTVDEDEFHALAGTEGASAPFFSPDGDWIGFRTADGSLRKIPAAGGPVTIITRLAGGFNAATWGRGDLIVYSPGVYDGLWQVSANGGTPTRFTKVDSTGAETHGSPSFLPDGKAVLFTRWVGTNERHLAVATLDGKITLLNVAGAGPVFVAPSYLVYSTADAAVSAVLFDPKSRRVTGAPVAMLEAVSVRANFSPLLGVAADGSLLTYMRGLPVVRLATVSTTGETVALSGAVGRYRHPRVSPDGTRIAVAAATDVGNSDIWIYDIKTAGMTRLTLDGRSNDPVWTPDGKRIAFGRTDAAGTVDTYTVAADGSDQPQLLIGGAGSQWPGVYMPDGKSMIFDERTGNVATIHVSLFSADGQRKELVNSPEFTFRLPAISSDGKWLAYTSNEAGRVDVFVRPFEGGTGRWQASINGGSQPVFSHDGKTLYYRDEGHVIAATYTGGAAFAITNRRNIDDRFAAENTINFDPFPDGKRLAVLMPVDQGSQLMVVVNWQEELRRKLGGR